VRALPLAVLVLACGSGSSKPSGPKQPPKSAAYAELERRIPKLVAAMDQLATDLAAVNDDCPKIAAVLRKWGSVYAIELDALWELKNKLTPDERELYEHDHEEDANRLGPVFDASISSCHGDEEVEDALTIAGFRRVETAR